MTRLLRSLLKRLGYQTMKIDRRFTVAGFTYSPDPCSVGLTPQGELTGRAAAELVRKRKLSGLKVLDICCGEGIVGLTLFSECRDAIDELHLADINIFNLNSLDRTIGQNGLEPLRQQGKIKTWLSNGLGLIPEQGFDIIVSNPPHIFRGDHKSDKLTPGALGTFDADWAFHRDFYEICDKYLSPTGEVWFLEYGEAATTENFLPYIKANPKLSYVEDFIEPRDKRFFWMITKRA